MVPVFQSQWVVPGWPNKDKNIALALQQLEFLLKKKPLYAKYLNNNEICLFDSNKQTLEHRCKRDSAAWIVLLFCFFFHSKTANCISFTMLYTLVLISVFWEVAADRTTVSPHSAAGIKLKSGEKEGVCVHKSLGTTLPSKPVSSQYSIFPDNFILLYESVNIYSRRDPPSQITCRHRINF